MLCATSLGEVSDDDGWFLDDSEHTMCESLTSAILRSHKGCFDRFMRMNVDVNKTFGLEVIKPLWAALYVEKEDIVRTLLERGAVMDWPYKEDSALLYAVRNDMWNMVCLLTQFGAKDDRATLRAALRRSHLGLIYLLSNGGDANGIVDQMSLLEHCVRKNVLRPADILIKHGAKVNGQEGSFTNPLVAFIELGCPNLSRRLIKGFPGNRKAEDFTDFEHRHNKMLDILISAGALVDVGKPNCHGEIEPPLFTAIKSGCIHCVSRLLKANVDITMEYRMHNVMTYSMANKGATIDICEKLYEKWSCAGNDINDIPTGEFIALLQAVKTQNAPKVKFCLEKGSYVNNWDTKRRANAEIIMSSFSNPPTGRVNLAQIIAMLIEAGEHLTTDCHQQISLPVSFPMSLQDRCRLVVKRRLNRLHPNINLMYLINRLGPKVPIGKLFLHRKYTS